LRERLARRGELPAAGPATSHQPPDGRQHMQEEEGPDVTRASHPEDTVPNFLLEAGRVDELRADVPGSLERQAAGGLRPADLVIPQIRQQREHIPPQRQGLGSGDLVGHDLLHPAGGRRQDRRDGFSLRPPVLMLLSSGGSRSPRPLQFRVDLLQIEGLGIELAAPLQPLVVLRMLRVLKGRQVLFIAPHAADVLGRAGPLSCEAGRVASSLLGGHNLLDHEGVLPGIAEIVLVAEAKAFARQELAERGAPLVDEAQFTKLILPGVAVTLPGDGELVQVIVLPPHDDLQDLVQLVKGGVAGHDDPPPDRGADGVE